MIETGIITDLKNRTVKFSPEIGFPRIFCDYIEDNNHLKIFYTAKSFQDIAAQLAEREFHRLEIADILTYQNKNWSAPPEVFEQIEKLREPNSLCVFTGQQAGLFGGPYLTLLKALGTIHHAKNLEQELNVPVVPVFWVASDDHDFQEIASVGVFDKTGSLQKIAVTQDARDSDISIGAIAYNDSISEAVETLASLLPDNDFKDDALRDIRKCYEPGANIADAFASYLHTLTGKYGLVLFNPQDKRAKKLSAGFIERILYNHDNFKSRLNQIEEKLSESGYPLQVEKAPTAVHLFMHSPQRVALHTNENAYYANDENHSREELLAKIASAPESFSTDVITRPLLQSYLFPTIANIAGPAEVAYYAQIIGTYEVFDLPQPKILARPSLSVTEKRFERIMDEHNLQFADLIGDIEAAINSIMQKSFPSDLEDKIRGVRENITATLDILNRELTLLDPNIKDMIDNYSGKIDYQVNELSKKIFAAHKRRNQTERDKIYRLHENLYPERNLPERVIAPVYFISRYGKGVIDFIDDHLPETATEHVLLSLSNYGR